MEPQTHGYSRGIMRLLENEDLAGLMAQLRQPAQPDLRGEAALALGDLGKFEATELLVRATHEDPEPQVRAAAQRALAVMFGSEANNVIASYSGPAPQDPWLIEPMESEMDNDSEDNELNLSDSELEGFVRVARHEASEPLRLQAIRVLGHSHSQAAIDILADLALWGDNSKIRLAAKMALENLYGDESDEILANYRTAALEEARESGTEEQLLDNMDLEDETSVDEDDEADEEDEEYDEEDDELAEEEEDDDEDDGEDESTPVRPPSPYLNASREPVTEEIGRPRWLFIGLVLVGLTIVIFLLLTSH